MASQATMLNIAWSLQRAEHGEQPYWMLVTLAAMLGQIGTPGGGFGVGYGAMNSLGHRHRLIRSVTLPQGDNPVSRFIPVARLSDMLLSPGADFVYQGRTYQYPDIRLIYWAGGNPFHHHQDLNRLRRAWAKPETVIVNEQYWTATAKHSDIVLPVTTTLERDDIGSASGEGVIVAMKRQKDPPGEARDDYDIFAGIAGRLGAGQTFTQGRDSSAWLERLYELARLQNASEGVEMPDFPAFWRNGLVDHSTYARAHVMLEAFIRNPERNPLSTASGQIEIASDTISAMNLPDCPGHPVWRGPREYLGATLASIFPFHLLSDQPTGRLHSQLDPAAASRAGKVAGREPVHMHPCDAAERGIRAGDIVELFNGRGRCLAGAVLNIDLMPGVVRMSTGAWFDPDPSSDLERHGNPIERHGNPNVLTADVAASAFSQGCSAQSCLVDIRKWREAPPSLAAFDPPEFAN
jgi:biotin/methionine sulfoxide reductase